MATAARKRRSPRKTNLSVKKVVSDVQPPLTILGGMFAGKFINDFLQKTFNKAAPTDGEVSGLAGTAVKYGVPAALLLTGIVLPNFIKLGSNGSFSKNIGTGISVYGGFVGAKELLGKDLLSGLKGLKGANYRRMGLLPQSSMQRRIIAPPQRSTVLI